MKRGGGNSRRGRKARREAAAAASPPGTYPIGKCPFRPANGELCLRCQLQVRKACPHEVARGV